jgi:hypothetical protein
MSNPKEHQRGHSPYRPKPYAPEVRRVPVDSVPFGRDSTHRPYVWGAYPFGSDVLVAWGVTADEARRRFYAIRSARQLQRQWPYI